MKHESNKRKQRFSKNIISKTINSDNWHCIASLKKTLVTVNTALKKLILKNRYSRRQKYQRPLARVATAESLQGLNGGLGFPVATRRCTKLSILFPFVSVSNRFPPNGNDSNPLSFSTTSSTSPSFLAPSFPKPNACNKTNAVNSFLHSIFHFFLSFSKKPKVTGIGL